MLNVETKRRCKSLGRRGGVSRPVRCILVTGFGSFPGVPFNASEHLLPDLVDAPLRIAPQPMLATAVLPTEWRLAVPRLNDIIAETQPDIALHLGVSNRAKGFVIETRAYNQTSAREDRAGEQAPARCNRKNAPISVAAFGSAFTYEWPARKVVARSRPLSVQCAIS